jgi:hypothetical protein
MKSILSITVFLFAMSAFAQTAAVKDIPADGDTNISITKGKNTQRNYEITESHDDIAGDPQILIKDARDSWKQACADWKKEAKEDNKDNQVIFISCGVAKCEKKDATEITCVSSGTVKVKTRIRD